MPKDGDAPKKGKEKQPETGRRLSYKYRIYPNDEQRRHFAVNFGCCRFVYNHFLAEREAGTIPAQLIDRVTSPGGTTIAGLLAAEEGGLSTALVGAVDASIHADSHLG